MLACVVPSLTVSIERMLVADPDKEARSSLVQQRVIIQNHTQEAVHRNIYFGKVGKEKRLLDGLIEHHLKSKTGKEKSNELLEYLAVM